MKAQALMSSRGHGGQSNYSQVDSPPSDCPSREQHDEVRTASDVLLRRPPPGQWRDGICSWANNLWPSCVCSFFICCGGWITGQIAQASGYQAFQSFVAPYMVTFTVFMFLFLVTHNPLCLLLPWFVVFVYAAFLRLHFVRKHELTQRSSWRELMLALLCCPCSLAQMARHSFGYRLVFDGDSRAEPPSYYPVESDLEAQVRELELTEHETQVLGRASHEV